MTEGKQEQGWKRGQFVYVGVRKTRQGKRRYAWKRLVWEINDGQELDVSNDLLLFGGKRNLGRGTPGVVYDFDYQINDDGISISGDNRDYAGRWQNGDQVVEWQARSRAEANAIAQANKRKQEQDLELVREALEPVRRAYRFAGSNKAKSHLLAFVIQEVTGRK